MISFAYILTLVAIAVLADGVVAVAPLENHPLMKRTADKCITNTKGKCPKTTHCSPGRSSSAIQAAECSYNTRFGGQTFAVFKTQSQYKNPNGAPYGTCQAYSCKAPVASEMVESADCWTFFWGNEGESRGVGTTCIKDPQTGQCGCETNDGKFHVGKTDCDIGSSRSPSASQSSTSKSPAGSTSFAPFWSSLRSLFAAR